MTFIHGIGIIRHNVVALARQAEQLINSGDAEVIDRAAIQTDMSALGRFLITKKEPISPPSKHRICATC